MDDLIEALTILRKYGNPHAPLHCQHDELWVVGIDPEKVSDDDKAQLDKLGFFVGDRYGDSYFLSFRFGSA